LAYRNSPLGQNKSFKKFSHIENTAQNRKSKLKPFSAHLRHFETKLINPSTQQRNTQKKSPIFSTQQRMKQTI